MIPCGCCNVPQSGARGKLSTIPVDNPGDKFRKPGKFPLIRRASPVCPIFRQLFIMLIIKNKIIENGQIIENIALFVTVL
jgi:hypothetical protein